MKTQASNVAGALEDAGIRLDDADVVGPSLEQRLKQGMTIIVRKAVPVTVRFGTELVELAVVGETVADALVAAGVDPAGVPGVTPDISSPLMPGMSIAVPDAVAKIKCEESVIAAGTKEQDDPTLAQGAMRVLDEGSPGTLLKIYRILVVNGIEGIPVLTDEQVVVEPRPRLVAVGSASSSGPSSSRSGRRSETEHSEHASRSSSRSHSGTYSGTKMDVVATGYSPQQSGMNSRTATGALARRGVVAVDKSVIPLGTRIYVPGYGEAVAADTGGGVKGAHIDLCFDTVDEAVRWGRRSVTITILD